MADRYWIVPDHSQNGAQMPLLRSAYSISPLNSTANHWHLHPGICVIRWKNSCTEYFLYWLYEYSLAHVRDSCGTSQKSCWSQGRWQITNYPVFSCQLLVGLPYHKLMTPLMWYKKELLEITTVSPEKTHCRSQKGRWLFPTIFLNTTKV